MIRIQDVVSVVFLSTLLKHVVTIKIQFKGQKNVQLAQRLFVPNIFILMEANSHLINAVTGQFYLFQQLMETA
jgi:hypothetical protein